MKRAPSQSVFLDRTYFLHFKFNQVEFICKHCPIQPLEMKELAFNERCAFYCKHRTQCPCLFSGGADPVLHYALSTEDTQIYLRPDRPAFIHEDEGLGKPSFCSQYNVRWQSYQK